MPSQSPPSERESERKLNIRTLVIASAASASAALIISQLWFAGTWIAAALTPVIVALVSELLHRPTERIGKVLTSDRTALFPVAEPPVPAPEPPRGQAQAEPDPDAPARRAEFGAPSERQLPARPSAAGDGPVRVYRAGNGTPPPGARRKLALGVVAMTAALAFLIAVTVITVPELIAGQSLVHSDKGSTLLGGTSRKHTSDNQDKTSQQQTMTERQGSEPTPTQTAPSDEGQTTTTPAPTATTPPPTTPTPQAAPPATTPTTP